MHRTVATRTSNFDHRRPLGSIRAKEKKIEAGANEKLRDLNYSRPVDLLILPRVASKLCDLSKAAGCATFLADMVGVSATSPASDMSALSAHLS